MDIATFPAHSSARSYLLEAKYEFIRLWRTPSFALPSLLFPLIFYVLFGVLLAGGRSGGEIARYLLATYGVFGIMGSALFGFGVTIAIERENGQLEYRRALPMPPGAMLLAKMAMAMLFAAITSVLLALIGGFAAGVNLAAWQWLTLFGVNVLGGLPFCAIGLLIGTCVGGSAAPAVVNLIYLPMAFLSGLWIPLAMLPGFIGSFAPALPSYHLAQIALKVVERDAGVALWLHLGVLVVVTVTCFMLARRRLAAAR
ncbi:MAG TPA: ABC transporter permease [Dokdonella sp.]|uniref:ABC transporter permease n=1 Tax=Dokdonella sp. TaxID=2291710 RepID=UPI0025C612DA|nr:ABC transporter permease [Dokdonella sp.]MBX3692237.1 ABC transporter permease [Dokdonella sp.]HNR90916.1 ABC transporter permease [Dokdonella sp.]